MRQKIRIIIAVLFILLPIFLIVRNTQKPMDIIYISHSSFGQTFPEYKIDLKNEVLWTYTCSDPSNYIARDPESPNEGYTSKQNLTPNKIQQFLVASKWAGFTHWRSNYDNLSVMDGHQWGVKIVFSDTTEKYISGSNKYPWTWDRMYNAFKELTGENILVYESDWL